MFHKCPFQDEAMHATAYPIVAPPIPLTQPDGCHIIATSQLPHDGGRLPITRQAIAKHLALLAEAGPVTAEPGERRRVRYRLRSAPMQVAQQFLAALARDWDGRLDALKDHLDQHARGSA
jgi:hypothetical protein